MKNPSSKRANFTINCVSLYWRHLPTRLLYNNFGLNALSRPYPNLTNTIFAQKGEKVDLENPKVQNCQFSTKLVPDKCDFSNSAVS